jgi:MFS family permease
MSEPTELGELSPDRSIPLRSLWYSTNFQKFIGTRWFNSFANQLITVTVGWQIYEMTGNPLDLGLVGLAQFAPIFFLLLAAGLAADRLNRRAIMSSCNLIHMLVSGFMLYYALVSGGGATWPIFIVLVFHGCARAFFSPSLASILPNLVEKERFPTAIAYVTSIEKLTQLAGPALAGFLLAVIGYWVYLIALISFAIAAVCSAVLVSPRRERPKRAIGFSELVSGFSYVWNKKLVLAIMTMDLVAILFSGILGMLPVFAKDILQVGPEGLGILRAMPGLGAVAVGFFLAQIPLKDNVGRTLIISVVIIGLSSTAFAFSDIFWLSLLLLLVFGAADMVSTNIRHTLVQLVTPDHMRGRVSAVNSATTNASNEIGDFRAGVSAALVGIVPAVAVGGLVTVSLSLLWWKIFPDLRKINMYGQRQE